MRVRSSNAIALRLLFLLGMLRFHGAFSRVQRQEAHDDERDEQKLLGRWVYAENVDLESARSQLPEGHPRLDDPYAKGLPQGLMTYEQRYGKYHMPSTDMVKFNELLPDSKHVVLLRTYPGIHWSEDYVMHIRAIAHEVHKSGWHFWLLQQDTLGPNSESTGTPASYLLHVPVEFRPLVITFTAEDLHSHFPLVHQYRERTGTQNDFKWREYLGATMFLERYSFYEFAFVVESDVRYTGADWGDFLNSVLHRAQGTLLKTETAESSVKGLQHLSTIKEEQPDLIMFSPGFGGPEPATRDNTYSEFETWRFSNIINHFTNIYGMSRQMHEHISKHTRQGFGGFIEQFIPSVALYEDVDVVIFSLGVWNKEDPLHCCLPVTSEMYDSWYTKKTSLATMAIHPVKATNTTIWKVHKE